MQPSSVERCFSRELAALESLFEFIAEFGAAHDVTEHDAREIELIAEELFSNCIRHSAGERDVRLELARIDDTIRIRLTDVDVDEFDLTQVPEPDPAMPLEARRPGGMGIILVRRLAQDVRYDYQDRTSTVTVVKRLRARAE